MKRIYRNEKAKKKEDLIKEIEKLIGIPSVNLVTFFATQDNSNRPSYKPCFDAKYDLQGFYRDRRYDGRIPDPWPDEIRDEIEHGSSRLGFCEHFIWISKRICEAEDIHFAWIYSHELQHLKQSLKNPYLLTAAKLLPYVLYHYEIPEVDIPTEFECESKAKEISIRIFGEENCILYLNRMKKCNCNRYTKLLELNVPNDFDVELKTQQDICSNSKVLKEIQNQVPNKLHPICDIDINKLCSIKNPHDAIISSYVHQSTN